VPAATLITARIRAAAWLCLLASAAACGQGGPPLVTDDPGTPGDGRWEINLAAAGSRTPGLSELSLPDADINYGWGERIQLKIDTPWLLARESASGVKSGLGASDLGLKWRFLGGEDRGLSLSTYPQLTHPFDASTARRGLINPGRQLFLPLEAAYRFDGGLAVDGELGRNLVQYGPDQWLAGLVLSQACGARLECLGEARERSGGGQALLLNLGARFRLSDTLLLLGSGGREIGPPGGARLSLLLYCGVQLLL
jgi:hypothetical protein